jgi:hypothetical protein
MMNSTMALSRYFRYANSLLKEREVMSVVIYRCPETHRDVETAIITDEATLAKMQLRPFKISVWCPHCQTSHEILASEAWVDGGIAA